MGCLERRFTLLKKRKILFGFPFVCCCKRQTIVTSSWRVIGQDLESEKHTSKDLKYLWQKVWFLRHKERALRIQSHILFIILPNCTDSSELDGHGFCSVFHPENIFFY